MPDSRDANIAVLIATKRDKIAFIILNLLKRISLTMSLVKQGGCLKTQKNLSANIRPLTSDNALYQLEWL